MQTVRERAAELLGSMTDRALCDLLLAEHNILVMEQTVRRWRRAAGIPAHGKRQHPITAEDVERAVRAWEDSERSVPQAARRLNWTHGRMERALRQARAGR